jgi:hypothetical protein
MKNVLLASAAVALFGLAGCASGGDAIVKDAVETSPVTYKAPPPAPAVTAAAPASSNPSMDLCLSKGGSIGEWAGADAASSTKTCQLGGSEYPLAALTSYEVFQ